MGMGKDRWLGKNAGEGRKGLKNSEKGHPWYDL